MFAELPVSIGHRPVYVERYVGLSVQMFAGLFAKEFVGLPVSRCLWVCIQMSVGSVFVRKSVDLPVPRCLWACQCPDVCKSVCPDVCRPVCPEFFWPVCIQMSTGLSVHASVDLCQAFTVPSYPNVQTGAK